MKWTIGFAIAFACGAAAAGDAKPSASCDSLASAVEAGAKTLSHLNIESMNDNTGTRATNRLLEMVIASNLVQSNLLLMQANKCNMPKVPVDDSAYRSAAIKCFTAKEPKDGVAPECVRTNWTRNND